MCEIGKLFIDTLAAKYRNQIIGILGNTYVKNVTGTVRIRLDYSVGYQMKWNFFISFHFDEIKQGIL